MHTTATRGRQAARQQNRTARHGQVFRLGMKDGLPIGLGYFAVSFSLGIAARSAGLSPLEGFVASLLTNASAGEYAVFTLIAVDAAYLEVALVTLIANARYLLMSCALSQRFAPETALGHRLLMGFDITIARPGYLDPFYTYGAMATSIPFWSTGTALGILAGNLLPARLVSAFGVALYGMFLAVIVPPARKSRIVLGVVLFSFLLSYLASVLPGLSALSDGNRTILLTVAMSAAAALLFPIVGGEGEE